MKENDFFLLKKGIQILDIHIKLITTHIYLILMSVCTTIKSFRRRAAFIPYKKKEAEYNDMKSTKQSKNEIRIEVKVKTQFLCRFFYSLLSSSVFFVNLFMFVGFSVYTHTRDTI